MEFNEILKSRRSELRLTLEDIARHVGVSGATVSRWEKGEIENVRRDKIAKLAEVLAVTPGYLMGWSELSPPSVPVDAPSGGINLLTALFESLNQKGQEKLLDIADDMIQSGKYKK